MVDEKTRLYLMRVNVKVAIGCVVNQSHPESE